MDTSETYIKMCDCGEVQGIIPEKAKAYLAGLFDGEGTVRIHRVDNKKNMSHKLLVFITNTNIHVLNWVKSIFGGNVYIHDRKDGIRKPQGRWHINTQEAYRVLKMIEPYLIVKKAHVRLGIEFVERLNRDASWHLDFAKRLKDIQGKEVQEEYPIYTLDQDQIQEMMDWKDEYTFWKWDTDTFDGEVAGSYYGQILDDEDLVLGVSRLSMEQVWLVFYMYEKHQRRWDGEKWVSDNQTRGK